MLAVDTYSFRPKEDRTGLRSIGSNTWFTDLAYSLDCVRTKLYFALN